MIILVKPYWKEAIIIGGEEPRREIIPGDNKKYPNSVRLQSGEMFEYASPTETPIQMLAAIMSLLYKYLTVATISTLIPFVKSVAQKNENRIEAINEYRKHINDDTTVKFFNATKEQLENLPFKTDAVTIYFKKDIIVKVSEWILHPPMKEITYYFKEGKLLLAAYSQTDYCGDKNFFYNNRKQIKVHLTNCEFRRGENDRKLSKYRLAQGKQFLQFLAG